MGDFKMRCVFYCDEIPSCKDCVHANMYVPVYAYPFSEPKCDITGKTVKSDDVCCEFFDDGKVKSHNCKGCGVNISDLVKNEENKAKRFNKPIKIVEYCEYCR